MGAAGFRPLLAAAALAVAGCTTVQAGSQTLDGTEWRVAAINGQATPASENYRLSFRGGSISGRFGCNHLGGKYTIGASTLLARDIFQTLMGCPEPAATFETNGTAVLRQPMRMVWTSDRTLTLSNAAGSITLVREQ